MWTTSTTQVGEQRILVTCHAIPRTDGGYEFLFEHEVPPGVRVRIVHISTGREIPLRRIEAKRYRFDLEGLRVFLTALGQLWAWKIPTRHFALKVGDIREPSEIEIPTPFPPYTGAIGIRSVRAIGAFMDQNGATYGGTATVHVGRVFGHPIGGMRFLEYAGVIETDKRFWGMGCIGFVGSVLGLHSGFQNTEALLASGGLSGRLVAGLPDNSSGLAVEKYFMNPGNGTANHSYVLWTGHHVVIVHQNVISEFNLSPKRGYNENPISRFFDIRGSRGLNTFHIRQVA
ncbi:MAG TPA: hypothetical protein VFB10_02885 [Candidatus Dormibacteraeota bacterium]|nr:hypothetical protein [Candidatus Dormibacteraeota bacterium]